MPHKLFRLGALLTALALALTACAPGVSSSGSGGSSSESIPVDASSMVMQDAVPTIEPEPEPEPMPVLTQEDIDAALAQVMEAGRLWGAGLDVTDPEPLPPDHPLWRQARAIITPHSAGDAHLAVTMDRVAAIALERLRRFL